MCGEDVGFWTDEVIFELGRGINGIIVAIGVVVEGDIHCEWSRVVGENV
jgi:hypothetical protein